MNTGVVSLIGVIVCMISYSYGTPELDTQLPCLLTKTGNKSSLFPCYREIIN